MHASRSNKMYTAHEKYRHILKGSYWKKRENKSLYCTHSRGYDQHLQEDVTLALQKPLPAGSGRPDCRISRLKYRLKTNHEGKILKHQKQTACTPRTVINTFTLYIKTKDAASILHFINNQVRKNCSECPLGTL